MNFLRVTKSRREYCERVIHSSGCCDNLRFIYIPLAASTTGFLTICHSVWNMPCLNSIHECISSNDLSGPKLICFTESLAGLHNDVKFCGMLMEEHVLISPPCILGLDIGKGF